MNSHRRENREYGLVIPSGCYFCCPIFFSFFAFFCDICVVGFAGGLYNMRMRGKHRDVYLVSRLRVGGYLPSCLFACNALDGTYESSL